MEGPSSWNALWRYVAAAGACAVLGMVSFGQDRRIPLLGWIDLALHEFGHVATLPLPDLATAMAGSVAQVALPLAIAGYFLARCEIAGAMLCLAWAGCSARDASVYVADAPRQELELIGGEHDWAFAIGPDGLDALDHAAAIAAVVRGLGLAMVLLAVAGAWRGRWSAPGWSPAGGPSTRLPRCDCASASSSPRSTRPARTPPWRSSAISS